MSGAAVAAGGALEAGADSAATAGGGVGGSEAKAVDAGPTQIKAMKSFGCFILAGMPHLVLPVNAVGEDIADSRGGISGTDNKKAGLSPAFKSPCLVALFLGALDDDRSFYVP